MWLTALQGWVRTEENSGPQMSIHHKNLDLLKLNLPAQNMPWLTSKPLLRVEHVTSILGKQ